MWEYSVDVLCYVLSLSCSYILSKIIEYSPPDMPKQGPSLKSSLLSLYIRSFPAHLLSASSSAHTVNYLTLPFNMQQLQQTI